jgi:phosphatidylethanolamine N-methyltransferase
MARKKIQKKRSSSKKNQRNRNSSSKSVTNNRNNDGYLTQHVPQSPRVRGRFDSTDYDDTDTETSNITSEEVLHGFTETNVKFIVPETHNTWRKLKRLHEIPTILTWACFVLTLYVGLPDDYFGYPITSYFGFQAFPPMYLFYVCIFWRLMYNVALGILLSYQSRTKGVTLFVSDIQKNSKNRCAYKILSFLVKGSTGCKDLNDKPAEFNAWVLNTQIVNVILPNDVFAFCIFAFREANFSIAKCGSIGNYLSNSETSRMMMAFVPQSIMTDTTCYIFYTLVYIVAFLLIGSSLYAKVLSHKVIGYYAWFWGDFFFRIDKKLTFDGIFNMFPHPMYTVGYAWMYGMSMLAGSFQVLGLTMFSHCLQIGFLAYCEEPHIVRTYGVEFPKTKRSHQENILIVKNFDPFRASDWSIIFILFMYIYVTVISGGVLGMESKVSVDVFLLNAIGATMVGRLVLMFLLYKQGKTKFWTSHFKSKNMSRQESFQEWKRLQNLLECVINISFAMLYWRVFEWPEYNALVRHRWFYFCLAMVSIMLFFVSYWSATESYNALGDFGWFYGDFFIKFENFSSGEVDYVDTGIFRFFKHPDILFGKCWLYALVILSGSLDVAAVAMLHHALCLVQLVAVEEPHMKKVYKRHLRRVKKRRA